MRLLPLLLFTGRPLAVALLFGLAASSPAAAQSGLVAIFYRGDDFKEVLLTRNDAAINFNWDYDAPARSIPRENYCVRWTGAIRAPVSGTYTFLISTDDGMRVWLGGKQIFNEWRPQSPSSFTTQVTLRAGEFYPLRVDYYQLGYQARAVLSWMLPATKEQRTSNLFALLKNKPKPIPASAFHARMPLPPIEPVRAPLPTPSVASSSKPDILKPSPAPATESVVKPVKPAVEPVARPVAKPRTRRIVKPVRTKPVPKAAAPAINPVAKPATRPNPKFAPAPAAKLTVRRTTRIALPATASRAATRRPAAIARAAVRPLRATGRATAPPTTADLGSLPKGTTLEIRNVFFEQSQAALLPASTPAIAQLAAALKQYPRVALEIAGHTDNVGNPVANQILSEQRARRVRVLLIERGVDSSRLTAVGYGGTRLVSNSTEPLLRARNRRVEVTVK
ncbi:MAG: OmpA family protein [Hymenobacteraceae bacterium]|nr:OmpA family protein [Hymenobacteraceae bacterium]